MPVPQDSLREFTHTPTRRRTVGGRGTCTLPPELQPEVWTGDPCCLSPVAGQAPQPSSPMEPGQVSQSRLTLLSDFLLCFLPSRETRETNALFFPSLCSRPPRHNPATLARCQAGHCHPGCAALQTRQP